VETAKKGDALRTTLVLKIGLKKFLSINSLSIRNKCAYLLESSKLVLPSGVRNTPKIAILRMCYGENGTVKFFETLADNVFRHQMIIYLRRH
jgi:hypothetical protein